MTKREAAIVSAYTGVLTGSFSDMHKYVEEIMGDSIPTSAFGRRVFAEHVKEKSKDDFLAIEVD